MFSVCGSLLQPAVLLCCCAAFSRYGPLRLASSALEKHSNSLRPFSSTFVHSVERSLNQLYLSIAIRPCLANRADQTRWDERTRDAGYSSAAVQLNVNKEVPVRRTVCQAQRKSRSTDSNFPASLASCNPQFTDGRVRINFHLTLFQTSTISRRVSVCSHHSGTTSDSKLYEEASDKETMHKHDWKFRFSSFVSEHEPPSAEET
ncbi:hypothetical protein BZA77DRAFT_290473 [Pyronema omphalodes]|nr:hypothetical protein BZA77DRAFT_290473 [Pyronema omphalodes]